jgi:hypothetical protein
MFRKYSYAFLSAVFLMGSPGTGLGQSGQDQPQAGSRGGPLWGGSNTPSCLAQGMGRGQGFGQRAMNGRGQGQSSSGAAVPRRQHDPQACVSQFPVYDVTADQLHDLREQWEQEKLSRDLYEAFAEKYGVRVFAHLAAAEQRHMGALEALLQKYGEALPSAAEARGVYATDERTGRYHEALQDGEASLVAAARVGVLNEEADAQALQAAVKRAQPDAQLVLGQLEAANGRHAQALSRWAEASAPPAGPVERPYSSRTKVSEP